MSTEKRWDKWQGQQEDNEKRTEKKSYQIPVCMAAIYARLSVDTDEEVRIYRNAGDADQRVC